MNWISMALCSKSGLIVMCMLLMRCRFVASHRPSSGRNMASVAAWVEVVTAVATTRAVGLDTWGMRSGADDDDDEAELQSALVRPSADMLKCVWVN